MPIATQAPPTPGSMGPPPIPVPMPPPPSPRKNLVSGLERSHSRAGHMRHGSTSSIGHSRGQSFSSLSSIGSLSNLNNLAGGSLPSPLGQMGQMGPPGLPAMPPAPPLGSEIAWTEIQSRYAKALDRADEQDILQVVRCPETSPRGGAEQQGG